MICHIIIADFSIQSPSTLTPWGAEADSTAARLEIETNEHAQNVDSERLIANLY